MHLGHYSGRAVGWDEGREVLLQLVEEELGEKGDMGIEPMILATNKMVQVSQPFGAAVEEDFFVVAVVPFILLVLLGGCAPITLRKGLT